MGTGVRYPALDILRGMTICFMIIVNTAGDYEHTFAPLLHAPWHGFTPTDLVFPSFLFVVGNAISFVQLKWQTLPSSQVVLKILKRTGLIFLLGYLMYWFPFIQESATGWSLKPIQETRVLGVLQRIALCYGIASLLIYFLQTRWVIAITLFLLVIYRFLLTHYGDLTLEGNAVLALDRWLMGESHLYHGEGVAFDPEGWLSTLPAIGNVVIGYLAGVYIQSKGKTYEGLTHLLLAGASLVALGYFWDSSFPINKKLW
ncbi:MAG: acyltransferase family protein, partial [Chitinophagaceae bacterium]